MREPKQSLGVLRLAHLANLNSFSGKRTRGFPLPSAAHTGAAGAAETPATHGSADTIVGCPGAAPPEKNKGWGCWLKYQGRRFRPRKASTSLGKERAFARGLSKELMLRG